VVDKVLNKTEGIEMTNIEEKYGKGFTPHRTSIVIEKSVISAEEILSLIIMKCSPSEQEYIVDKLNGLFRKP